MKDKEKYLRNIYRALPNSFTSKKQYLTEMKSSVDAYCAEHEHAAFDELCSRFGTAEEICESIASETDGKKLIANNKKVKTNRTVIAAVIVAVIAAAVIAVICIYNHSMKDNVRFTEEITVNKTTIQDLTKKPITTDNSDILLKDTSYVRVMNATKETCLENKKGEQLFQVSVTASFLYPYAPVTDELKEIAARKPQVDIEISDDEYTVTAKNVSKEENNIRVLLEITKGSETSETEISFYTANDGVVH